MQLAMYKGPADDWLHKLGHWIVCIGTLSRYSHVELVIDGWCWSSSARDGGVRCKSIDLDSGHWDLYEVAGDAQAARDWFVVHRGEPYDWLGVLRFVPILKWLPRRRRDWFCSESVAAAIGLSIPDRFTPASLLRYLKEHHLVL